MSTISTIGASDTITSSRAVINSNFDSLNTDKLETSVIDTDTALSANSDSKVPSQKAVKAYIDNAGSIDTGLTQGMTAGATINGASTPVPVYLNKSDSEVYACDANDTNALKFLGFAVTNGTNGNAISVQMAGIVDGFSGLTVGEKYYVQDTVGTIGTTAGTYEILVGVAISATQLVIQKGRRRASGRTGSLGTASGSSAVTCGFRPSVIRLFGIAISSSNVSQMTAVWINGSFNVIYSNYNEGSNGAVNGDTTANLYSDDIGAANYMTFTITSLTDTGFTITWTETGSFTNDSEVLWEAEGEL